MTSQGNDSHGPFFGWDSTHGTVQSSRKSILTQQTNRLLAILRVPTSEWFINEWPGLEFGNTVHCPHDLLYNYLHMLFVSTVVYYSLCGFWIIVYYTATSGQIPEIPSSSSSSSSQRHSSTSSEPPPQQRYTYTHNPSFGFPS